MRWAFVGLVALACACDNSDTAPDGGSDSPGDGPSPGSIKLTLTNRPNNAAAFSFFVAYQDGAAPWTVAPAPTGDTYTFTVHAPSYSVAWGCIGTAAGTTTQLRTITTAQFAVDERTELSFDVPARCSDRQTDVTLSGRIINRPAGATLVVQYGSRTAVVGPTGNYTLQTPPGTRDLIVSELVPLGTGEGLADHVVVERDVGVPAATSRNTDFAPSVRTTWSSVLGVPSNAQVTLTTTLNTGNGTAMEIVRESNGNDTGALAMAQRRTTDVYDQSITVLTQGGSLTVTNATNAPTMQTYSAPQALGTASAKLVSSDPYPVLESAWSAYANAVGYAWTATQQRTAQQCGGSTACTVVWNALVSPGVTGMQPGFRMPDLSTVTGWKSEFQLVPNVAVTGGVTAQTSSAGAGDFPPPPPANGTKRTFARSDFSVSF